ncbi:CDP-alcohol phosphatidyltransferase family protein [Rhodococcus sp. X156]|uniref:CDP-alcohol phosphatidyltransferase family protein n=1 Tax=Rhodococcus sp. X156 TaxID=2499145 RepID=UPI000FDC7D54|nr:CDP-alcohol phosphatidyltransferase family protein [Rhodococcus sp. X156]
MATERGPRPRRTPVGGVQAYLDGWSAQHQGITPDDVPLLSGWLRVMYVLAVPLVRLRVTPDVLTAVGLLVSLAVPVLAEAGLPVVAAVAVLVSVAMDGLDGAVAVLSGRVSRYGRALDSVADRFSELAWWVALVLTAGVPVWQVVVFGALALGMEASRARGGRYGAITVWERPSRAVLAVVGLVAVEWDATGFTGPATGWVGVVLAVLGAAHLVHARRAHAR